MKLLCHLQFENVTDMSLIVAIDTNFENKQQKIMV